MYEVLKKQNGADTLRFKRISSNVYYKGVTQLSEANRLEQKDK